MNLRVQKSASPSPSSFFFDMTLPETGRVMLQAWAAVCDVEQKSPKRVQIKGIIEGKPFMWLLNLESSERMGEFMKHIHEEVKVAEKKCEETPQEHHPDVLEPMRAGVTVSSEAETDLSDSDSDLEEDASTSTEETEIGEQGDVIETDTSSSCSEAESNSFEEKIPTPVSTEQTQMESASTEMTSDSEVNRSIEQANDSRVEEQPTMGEADGRPIPTIVVTSPEVEKPIFKTKRVDSAKEVTLDMPLLDINDTAEYVSKLRHQYQNEIPGATTFDATQRVKFTSPRVEEENDTDPLVSMIHRLKTKMHQLFKLNRQLRNDVIFLTQVHDHEMKRQKRKDPFEQMYKSLEAKTKSYEAYIRSQNGGVMPAEFS